jgi:hypothetical protein
MLGTRQSHTKGMTNATANNSKICGSETNESNGQKDNDNKSLRHETLIMQILPKATNTRVHSLRNEYDDCHRNKY